jgi:hypothetical protein
MIVDNAGNKKEFVADITNRELINAVIAEVPEAVELYLSIEVNLTTLSTEDLTTYYHVILNLLDASKLEALRKTTFGIINPVVTHELEENVRKCSALLDAITKERLSRKVGYNDYNSFTVTPEQVTPVIKPVEEEVETLSEMQGGELLKRYHLARNDFLNTKITAISARADNAHWEASNPDAVLPITYITSSEYAEKVFAKAETKYNAFLAEVTFRLAIREKPKSED